MLGFYYTNGNGRYSVFIYTAEQVRVRVSTMLRGSSQAKPLGLWTRLAPGWTWGFVP
jgi:hypothetical protein